MDFNIRPYRPSDLEPVARLFTASVHGLAVDHYNAAQRAAWAPDPPDLAAWAGRLGALQTRVAVGPQAQIVGFVSFAASGHIDLLYTSPQHARRGVASALLGAAQAVLLESGVRVLFTEASAVARPFFEGQGFVVTEAQRVERRGVALPRWAMRKPLAG